MGGGGARDFGYALCNTLSFDKFCNPADPEFEKKSCTGISRKAAELINNAIKKGKLPGVKEAGEITRDPPWRPHHVAVQVEFEDGTTVVLDWHASLDPNNPQVSSVTEWCGGGCTGIPLGGTSTTTSPQ